MTKEEKKKRKSFSEFYDAHIKKVYRFIYFKVSSEEASEDITAEAFTRLWEQMNSPTEVENPRAYIYQVARNLVIDYYRTKKPAKVQPEDITLESKRPNPEESAVLDSEVKRLQKALSRLKDSYQNALILYYLDEVPVPEIAQILGKSEGAVRVTVHRALKALEEELEKEGKKE